MTADVMAHQRDSYTAAGMDGMVPKPFSPLQLLSEIVRLLSEPAEDQDEGAPVKASA
ncbi:MAG TPA: hypothetical protein VIO94_15105 [Phenylobacterium sp.]